jgi:hypothetical protein
MCVFGLTVGGLHRLRAGRLSDPDLSKLAAQPLEGLAEGGLALNPLGFAVDVCKADFRAKPRC